MPTIGFTARTGSTARRGFIALALLLAASPASANTVVATIPVGQDPYGVTVLPDGSRAYVASFTADNVSVIDPGAFGVSVIVLRSAEKP